MMRILFVCMGNICRSPTAEGVFRKLLAEEGAHLDIDVDSAGTHSFHVGSPPDKRTIAAALRRGIDLSGLRARQVTLADYEAFDFMLAMDEDNLAILRAQAPANARAKLRLFLEFASLDGVREVPDPYYGGENGFEHVLDLVDDAARGLLRHLESA